MTSSLTSSEIPDSQPYPDVIAGLRVKPNAWASGLVTILALGLLGRPYLGLRAGSPLTSSLHVTNDIIAYL